MFPPMTAAETTVMPIVSTRTLTVSHSGPLRDRRYWHRMSSHAHANPLCRLRRVRTASQSAPPVRGMAVPADTSNAAIENIPLFAETPRAPPRSPKPSHSSRQGERLRLVVFRLGTAADAERLAGTPRRAAAPAPVRCAKDRGAPL